VKIVGLPYEWQARLQSFVGFNQNPAIRLSSTFFEFPSADFHSWIYLRQGYERRNKKGGRFKQSPLLQSRD